ncbi:MULTISPECIES: hypothetical protein [Mesorhizobium]|uniref:ParE family toxin-like protein n=1 Tax=Mesorhizobium sp. TaxID=1871066 RepID=UPI0033395FBF
MKTAIVNQSKGGQAFCPNAFRSFSSLHFRQVGRYWSARVDENYRAVAIRNNEDVIWFWVGTHADYDHLLK